MLMPRPGLPMPRAMATSTVAMHGGCIMCTRTVGPLAHSEAEVIVLASTFAMI